MKYLQGFLNKLIIPTISDEDRETPDLIFSEEETKAVKSPEGRVWHFLFVFKRIEGQIEHEGKLVEQPCKSSRAHISALFLLYIFPILKSFSNSGKCFCMEV